MCGIFGIVKTKGPALEDGQKAEWARLLGSLAALSTIRGMDSTGLMTVATDGTVKVTKDAVPAWEFLTRDDWRGLATPTDATLATIGHTRLATHGAVTAANAHPFQFTDEDGDATAGVHNGVINNHAQFAVGRRAYAVDSANFIAALAAVPVREWRTLLRRATGTVALALVRVTGGVPTIHLTRRGNPLWVTYVMELNAVAFASTKTILEGAVNRSRLTCADTRELEEGTFYDYAAGGPVREGRRWLNGKERDERKEARKAAKASAKKGGRPACAVSGGTNGKEYVRCESCTNWTATKELETVRGRRLCTFCKKARDAGPWRDSTWVHEGGDA